MPRMEFDYVIVGGGSAGCVLAGRLSEDPQVSVALLEAGEADTSVLIHCPAGLAVMAKEGKRQGINWAFETVPQPGLAGRRGYQPRGRVLGGSSSINAMIYMRGQPEDYDGWAAEGNPGWGWADVLPWFKRAEHNERGADEYHGSGGPLNVMDLRSPNALLPDFIEAGRQAGYPINPDVNGATQEGIGVYQVTHKNGERFSAAKAYVTPNLGRPNLKVFTGTRTLRVLLEGKRAVGVEALRGRERITIRARGEVLLSAGALQSPQLLMLSGIGAPEELQRHGIAVAHALPGVGRHLHDHVDVVQVVLAPAARSTFGLSLGGVWKVLQGVGEWRRHRRGMLTTNFGEAGGFIKSRPEEATPDLQLHFVIAKLVDHGRKTVLGHGYSCHVCVLRPKSRGSLTLAGADPLAAPVIDPAFFGDPDDLARLVRGFKLMRSLLAQPALAQYGGRESPTSAGATTDSQIEQFVRQYADTIYHPVGSCRMGPAAPGSTNVVDHQLRVHGIERLRVVDASIMPSIVSGNTNAPAMMIGEKAAAMVKEARRQGTTAAAADVVEATLPGVALAG
jgi:choline dehydrogenase-like flavoprotein